MEADYCFHYARLTEAIFLQTTTCCWAQLLYCDSGLQRPFHITRSSSALKHHTSSHVMMGRPVGLSCCHCWDLTAQDWKQNHVEALLRHENHHVTHTTLQFSKDKKAISATTERLGGKSSAPPDRPKAPLSTPRIGTGNHILLAKQQRNLKLHYRVYLVLVQELFLFGGFGNLPKQGQSLGCSVLRAITHPCHCLLLPPLRATCAPGILLGFVDHMHQWSFHHLHFPASQPRPALPGSAGTLDTHFAGCCTSQGKLHIPREASRVPSLHKNPAWPMQVAVKLKDCVKHKTNRLVFCHQLSHSNVSWPPGKVGMEEGNSQC